MRRGAARVAEDRVLAVRALPGVTARAAVEEARVLQAPVPAARRLEQIAADRPHRPQLRRGRQRARLAQRLRHLGIDLELADRRARADASPVDPSRDELADVDERLRLDDA